MKILIKYLFLIFLFSAPLLLCSWGFYAHKLINRTAVFSLPAEVAGFYKAHIAYITEHAVDPDKRCYTDTLESPRHYIDMDGFGGDDPDSGPVPIDSIPVHWSRASAKFGERVLLATGIIPWQIERTYRRLRDAMHTRDPGRILRYTADLGHYIGDAHVPLHTTKNYNGQYTGQRGIHAFWETRLPERYAAGYNLWVGRAEYIPDVLTAAWDIIRTSHALIDSVLLLEKELGKRYGPDRKYAYAARNNALHRTYSEAYTRDYHEALDGMVERRMRASIRHIASFWYSAWVDAGQPDLRGLTHLGPVPKGDGDDAGSAGPAGSLDGKKILGRTEWH